MTGTCGATHVELHKMDQLDPNTLLRLALSAQEEISRRGLAIPTAGAPADGGSDASSN